MGAREPWSLPDEDAPAALWRSLAGRTEPALREALCARLPRLPEGTQRALLPSLLARSKGAAHQRVLEASLAVLDPPAEPLWLLLLCAEALGPSESCRALALGALARAEPSAREAVGLALWLCANLRAARGAGERERAALRGWVERGGPVPPHPEHEAEALWRAWLEGRRAPEALDLALVLACAGAPKACAEWLRAALERLVERTGRVQERTAELLAWLARECVEPEDRPPWVAQVEWRPAATRALATSALEGDALGALLEELARRWPAEPEVRPVALAVLRVLGEAPQRLAREEPAALRSAGESWVEALERASDGAAEHREALAALLGERATGERGLCWAGAAVRARLLELALTRESLQAVELAVRELEARGVPVRVLPALQVRARRALQGVLRARLERLSQSRA